MIDDSKTEQTLQNISELPSSSKNLPSEVMAISASIK